MSKIQWTEATWNPVVGCSVVSPGCTNCYAMRQAQRIQRMGAGEHYRGTTKVVNGNPVWTGKLGVAPPHIFAEPMRRRKPTTYFVNSMSDLFHEGIEDSMIDRVFAVMALARDHTFQVLTKRAERMRAYMTNKNRFGQVMVAPVEGHPSRTTGKLHDFLWGMPWPLTNVWLGVSAERQQEADARIPHLLETPAAIRFVSAEPLLGPIDFTDVRKYNPRGEPWIDALRGLVTRGDYLARSPKECSFNTRTQIKPPELPGLNWVIVGGESGPGARAFNVEWARGIVAQCSSAGVACFVKQLGAKPYSVADKISHRGCKEKLGQGFSRFLADRKGGEPREWPEDLRVREMPTW